ncbi:hypothetical protein SLA2020_470140 [Shorea laevis]
MLLVLIVLSFHVWSCQTSFAFFSGCPIPVANDPDKVVIPEERTQDEIVKKLTYIAEDKFANDESQSSPLFGGHQNWLQREESFKLKATIKVHCGFMKNGGAEMDPADVEYVKKCQFVVASGIFDKYDIPHQPSNISECSKMLFRFLMVVDEVSLNFIKENVTTRKDSDGGPWVVIWCLILFKHQPYDEPRRNGKVPTILTRRLFPQAQYSIWIDGKMELIVDPLLILEKYLWRGKRTYAIAQHKYHRMNQKLHVPEGAMIIHEHTLLNYLFSCLWFNEVHLFTARDQLSFGCVVYRLGGSFKFHMFPNCEYNSLFVLHLHNREHSSRVEWVKSWSEFKGNGSSLKESKGGFGLWSPYAGNLDSVVLPKVVRT